MSRKDYILIARALRSVRSKPLNTAADCMFGDIVDKLCNVLAFNNPNFTTSKFREACYK